MSDNPRDVNGNVGKDILAIVVVLLALSAIIGLMVAGVMRLVGPKKDKGEVPEATGQATQPVRRTMAEEQPPVPAVEAPAQAVEAAPVAPELNPAATPPPATELAVPAPAEPPRPVEPASPVQAISAPVPPPAVEQPQDPKLTMAFADIKSANVEKVRLAIRILRGYSESKPAYEALRDTALKHANENVRTEAVFALSQFPAFASKDTMISMIRRDKESVGSAVLQVAAQLKFSGYEEVLMEGLKSKHPRVRQRAAETAGYSQALKAEDLLVKLARYETDRGVKESAYQALAGLKSSKGLEVFNSMLRSGGRDNKHRAFRYLRLWENDAAALAILEKYRNDPDIGAGVSEHLMYQASRAQ